MRLCLHGNSLSSSVLRRASVDQAAYYIRRVFPHCSRIVKSCLIDSVLGFGTVAKWLRCRRQDASSLSVVGLPSGCMSTKCPDQLRSAHLGYRCYQTQTSFFSSTFVDPREHKP